MPVIHFSRDEVGDFPCLSEELLSVMAYPGDAAERENCRATLVLDRVVRAAGNRPITVTAPMLRAVLDGRGLSGLRKHYANAGRDGIIAGDILLDLLHAQQAGQTPNVRLCVDNQVEQLRRYENYGGETATLAERRIRDAWRDYRTVAHLWAAVRTLQGKLASARLDAQLPERQERWELQLVLEQQAHLVLGAGMSLLRRASTLMSDNGSKSVPLMDEREAWTSPPGIQWPES